MPGYYHYLKSIISQFSQHTDEWLDLKMAELCHHNKWCNNHTKSKDFLVSETQPVFSTSFAVTDTSDACKGILITCIT